MFALNSVVPDGVARLSATFASAPVSGISITAVFEFASRLDETPLLMSVFKLLIKSSINSNAEKRPFGPFAF